MTKRASVLQARARHSWLFSSRWVTSARLFLLKPSTRGMTSSSPPALSSVIPAVIQRICEDSHSVVLGSQCPFQGVFFLFF